MWEGGGGKEDGGREGRKKGDRDGGRRGGGLRQTDRDMCMHAYVIHIDTHWCQKWTGWGEELSSLAHVIE